MLEFLRLAGVGPQPHLELEFAPRLNLVTGDNGLGKSFLLDIAWWALTRSWADLPAMPRRDATAPKIAFRFRGETKTVERTISFDRSRQSWPRKRGRPAIPGLVLYARSDGSFALWDPARNAAPSDSSLDSESPPAYFFSPDEVWNGLRLANGDISCNGLILDWVNWQLRGGAAFEQLRQALRALSPSPDEVLEPGEPTRIRIGDARDIPTLAMPYGQEVPVVHASAGMRRILALAYLLVWTWQEHQKASELLGRPVTREIIFLIDEIEAHLHPRWQRVILRALLHVMDALTGESDVSVQLVAATHSPLLLTSTEPWFDPERDAIWSFDLDQGHVELNRETWYRRGDANRWLTSPVFDLEEPRSQEAERAILDARRILREASPSEQSIRAVDMELRGVLGDLDPFWVRWSAFVEGALEGSHG